MRLLLTAPPPTPNGGLHLGHLSGPYLATDIARRAALAEGHQVTAMCGTDANQSYVLTKAWQTGHEAGRTAVDNTALITEAFAAAGIGFDLFTRPLDDAAYPGQVDRFVRALAGSGAIRPAAVEVAYCEDCDRHLHQAYVAGLCPHCGAGAGGGSCEECGLVNQGVDLGDPRCTSCGAKPGSRTVDALVFPLEPHREALRAFWDGLALPPRLARLCEAVLAAPMPEILVSHRTEWGLPVPVDGCADQILDVWVEMAGAYQHAEHQGEQVWTGADRIWQFLGFDNAFYYVVLFPALMHALTGEPPRVSGFVVNEFYLLDGLKFSTSRNHAVWASEILASVPADLVRGFLAYDRPAPEQTDFTQASFRAWAQRFADVWDRWAGWCEEALAVTATAAPRPADEAIRPDGTIGLAGAARAWLRPESFAPDRALRAVEELLRLGSAHGAAHLGKLRTEPGPRELRAAVGLLAEARETLAVLAPVMPQLAAEAAAVLDGGDTTGRRTLPRCPRI